MNPVSLYLILTPSRTAVWVSLIIYLITWHTIDGIEREREVILMVILTSQITHQHGQ